MISLYWIYNDNIKKTKSLGVKALFKVNQRILKWFWMELGIIHITITILMCSIYKIYPYGVKINFEDFLFFLIFRIMNDNTFQALKQKIITLMTYKFINFLIKIGNKKLTH